MSITNIILTTYGVSLLLWLFINPYIFIRFYGYDSYKDAITYKRHPTFFKMFWYAIISPIHSLSIIFSVMLDIQLKIGKVIESLAIKGRKSTSKNNTETDLSSYSKEEIEQALLELEKMTLLELEEIHV